MGKALLRWLLVGAFIGLGIGAVIGLVLSRFVDLPAVEALTTYRPAASTHVLARDGSTLGSFAAERRIPVGSEEIPSVFRDAVIAVEDANFYRHTGVDPQGIVRAALRNLITGRWSQGASTLTQQLTRSLGLLSREKKLARKIKEMLLAIEIEQRFSKDQIFTMYANQVNFGHGNYGVEAASRFYFGKPAKELTLPEAALLAGLPQRPGELSPIDYPKRALERRNHVLDRMLDEKYIDKATWQAARQAPLGASAHHDRNVTAAYFVEEVRRSIEEPFRLQARCSRAVSRSTPRSTASCRRWPRTRCARGWSGCRSVSAGRARAATPSPSACRTPRSTATTAGRSSAGARTSSSTRW